MAAKQTPVAPAPNNKSYMRNKIILGLAALLCAGGLQAQTNPPPSLGGIASTVGGWVTSINTNYSFADVITWDGPVYANQVNVANELGGSYDLWHQVNVPNNATGTILGAAEGRFRQGGIGGVFVSEGGGGEFGWMKGDFRAAIFVDGVKLETPGHKGAWEFGVQVEKLFTANGTGAAFFISKQEHQNWPFIGGSLSVSFGTIGGLFSHF